MNNQRILVAGIGNIFLGDDAFGVEVVQHLLQKEWPENVKVVDFGIRGFDLAYALLDGYDTAILVDALPQGKSAGTLYILEPDLNQLNQADKIEFVDFNRDFFYESVRALNPHAPIFEVSCRTGAGLNNWTDWLLGQQLHQETEIKKQVLFNL